MSRVRAVVCDRTGTDVNSRGVSLSPARSAWARLKSTGRDGDRATAGRSCRVSCLARTTGSDVCRQAPHGATRRCHRSLGHLGQNSCGRRQTTSISASRKRENKSPRGTVTCCRSDWSVTTVSQRSPRKPLAFRYSHRGTALAVPQRADSKLPAVGPSVLEHRSVTNSNMLKLALG
jgi:hypothetical protein